MKQTSFFWRSFREAVVLAVILLSALPSLSAEVRSSASFRLESDSINFGGGLGVSNNFAQESTFGEVATGVSDSPSFSLRAGYQQMQEVFVSVTVASSVLTLSPALGGLTGGTSSASTVITVLTDSPSGYELTVQASASPALRRGSEVIADYLPVANPVPDFSFIIPPGGAQFGFAVAGADVVARYRNNGSTCAVGSNTTPQTCWDGLSTNSRAIARGSANQPAGTATQIFFQVGIGGAAGVLPGTYIATTTVTALPL